MLNLRQTICPRNPYTSRRERRTRRDGFFTPGTRDSARHVTLSQELAHSNPIQRALAGDQDAQEQLFNAHTAQLFPIAFRILGNREDAQDAVQDGLLSGWTNLRFFKGQSSFSTWLTRIVINSALMIRRKRRIARRCVLDISNETHEAALVHLCLADFVTPERVFFENERKNALRRGISKLRPKIRAVLEVSQIQELSLQETAETLGISPAVVKARLFRARAALQKSVRRHSDQPLSQNKGENR
jgi:RNA polymerase sigma factor (sigma-70 family)